MPIAAIPEYLGQDLKTASPGMRFGMYLSLWNSDFSKPKTNGDALASTIKLSASDSKIAASLALRQSQTFATVSPTQALRLQATATTPFTTGLGNEHPLENGFAFLNPYGLPYLPGSGVKGV
ncbi:MAG: RAMP superfamily CRISPR-associated protein, partial [Hydrogenophaga sp.]